MATTTGSSTTFPNLGPKVAAARHPIYDLLQLEWEQLGHVREGTGGFKTGEYLVAHPREWRDHTTISTVDGKTITTANPNPRVPSEKLKARRRLARYENLASTILETKKSALFREGAHRRVGPAAANAKSDEPTELEQWWENVDGKGTHINDAMPAWWDLAATFGHIWLYFELPPAASVNTRVEGSAEAATAADQGWPYVRVYTPLDVINWLNDDDGKIISIKVVEAVQAETYSELKPVTQYRVRIINEEGWELYDYKSGKAIDKGEHGLGRLPAVQLFGKRRAILSDVGQSVLGDPRLYIDVFNLTSEMRELERNQTFTMVNVQLGTGDNATSVIDAQTMMGQQTGVMNILFTPGAATMLSGDAENVATYREDIQQLKRDIYREAGVQWETDSKDAEAEGSLSLKREELNTRLAAYGDECEQAEYELVNCWYRWKYGADSAEQKQDDDDVIIKYPDRFDATPFDDVLAQLQAATSAGMPAIFLKEFRKSIVSKFEGMANLTPDLLKKINDEIDKAPDDPTPAERMQQRMELMTKGVLGAKPPKDPTKEEKAA